MYFFIFFTCFDNLFPAVMAYDRYVAICHPLRYAIIMREELCLCMLAESWLLSCASALTHTILLDQLSFCADIIPHFFCDLTALLKLSCSDNSLNEMVLFTLVLAVVIFPLSGILVSYGCIWVSILRVPYN